MQATSTLPEDVKAFFDNEVAAVPETKAGGEEWPLGRQLIQVTSRTSISQRFLLVPMEPFIRSDISYRIKVEGLERLPPESRVDAFSQGGRIWKLEEGDNILEFPSREGRLLVQVYISKGPGAVQVTTGELRRPC